MRRILNPYALLNVIHRLLGRSKLAARIALLVRNQSARVVRYHLCETTDPTGNGEALLLDVLGPEIRTFLDVGANVGNWTELARKRCPNLLRGVLLEPSSVALVHLRERYRDDPRITVVNAAAGAEEGETRFYEEAEAGETSSTVPGFSRRDAIERTVRSVRLDTLVGSLGLTSIDLVKIDAEGADFSVMIGAKQLLNEKAIKVVQFEYNQPWALAGATLAGALRLFAGAGYTVFRLSKRGLSAVDYERYGEYFDYSNFVAASTSALKLLSPLMVGTAGTVQIELDSPLGLNR